MKRIISSILLVYIPLLSIAQEDKKELKSEEVKVVKAYTPEVADAPKLRVNPTEVKAEKPDMKLEYKIFTPKVISTFQPNKISGVSQPKDPDPKYFNNYLILGYGMYKTPVIDFYMNNEKVKKHRYGVNLSHISSQGGIDGVRLNDSYINTKLDLFYWKQFKNYKLKSDLYYNFKLNNYYGSPDNLITDQIISNINVANYYNVLGGSVSLKDNNKFEQAAYTGSELKAYYLWDRFSTSESSLRFNSDFNVSIQGERINLGVDLDYLNSSFKQGLISNDKIDNSYFIMGLKPNFIFSRNNIKFNLGLNFAYAMGGADNDNLFRVYPMVGASVNLVDDLMVARASLSGSMENNSYRNILRQNPFVSPTFEINPLRKDIVFNAAIEGRLTSKLHYLLEGEYSNEKGFVNFIKNKSMVTVGSNPNNPWEINNSFTAAMDTVNHIKFSAQVDYEIIKDLNLMASASIHNYSTDVYDEVFNLPSIEFNFSATYNFLDDFYVGTSMYYADSRYYGEYSQALIASEVVTTVNKLGELPGYFDMNLEGEYQITKQLSVFANFNNIFAGNYELYKDFKVQGFQALAGVTYKF
jgi:hypothetical protein